MQSDLLASYFDTVFSRMFVELRRSDGEVLIVSRQWWKSFLSELDEKPSSEQVFRDTCSTLCESMALDRVESARKAVLAALTKAREERRKGRIAA